MEHLAIENLDDGYGELLANIRRLTVLVLDDLEEGVAVEDAGSGAEEAAERDWVAVVEAVEAGSTRWRVQESSGGGA